MPQPTLSRRFRSAHAGLWKAILDHPFVRGIGSGRLSQARFEHYLAQDYVYLIEFSRVLALSSARSAGLPDMRRLAELLHATLAVEMDLHRRTCADFGIDAKTLERTQPALVTQAYTDMLVRTCYEGAITDILAALLPCEQGYAEIGLALKQSGLPADRHYREWILTYTSPEFLAFAEWVAVAFDALSMGATERDVERWRRLYAASARFELLFFDMSWRRETWPRIVPAHGRGRARKRA